MAGRYREIYFTPDVLAAQTQYYNRAERLPVQPGTDALTAEEIEFIERRDSFYLATVSSDGWPYVQHRGGPAGFLKVISPLVLAFADYKGNRQLLSTGNLAGNDKVALFLMDYPRRERLKILGHARVEDARSNRELVERVAGPGERGMIERVFIISVVSFDWNCSKYISPRYSEAEVLEIVAPLKARILEMNAASGSAKEDAAPDESGAG